MEPTYALSVDTLDYSIDELDDISDRKVGPIPVGGDSLARLIRARRGTARATGQPDPYVNATDNADFGLWNNSGWPTSERRISDRRMAATGYTDGGDGLIADHVVDGRVEYGYFVPQSK